MDEAVLRIVLQEGAAAAQQPAPATPASAPTQRTQSTSPPVTQAPPPQQRPPSPSTTGAEPDWMKRLVDGIEGANRHVLIEGQSGSGKSMLTRHLAFQRMEQGEEVSVVDPHTPEQWKGAKQVFSRESAGTDAAQFLRETLRDRERERNEAKALGKEINFKPMTVVFSDFARLLKDTPKLGDEMRTLLTEARKFNIAIVADTTALTGAETGLKGIINIRRNFAQKVQANAPSAEDPMRTVDIGGKRYETPVLPEYKERFDPSIIRTPSPPPPPPPEPAKELIDVFLEIAHQLRGTIGSTFGGLLGPVLDVTAAFRKLQIETTSAAEAIPKASLIPDTLSHQEDKPSTGIPTVDPNMYRVGEDIGGGEHEVYRDWFNNRYNKIVKEWNYNTGNLESYLKRIERLNELFPELKHKLEGITSEGMPVMSMAHVEGEKPSWGDIERWKKKGNWEEYGSEFEWRNKTGDVMSDVTPDNLIKKINGDIVPIDVGMEPGPDWKPQTTNTAQQPTIPSVQKPLPVATPVSSGASAMASAATAVPMVAAALAAKEVAKQINDSIMGAIKGTISGIGGAAESAVTMGADPSADLSKMGEAAVGVGEKMNEIIPLSGTFAVVVGESTKALAGLMDALDATADRYGEFNPDIAQAQAIADINRTMGDMRRAQETGPELARFVESQAELQQKFEDIKVKLLERILEVVNPILEILGAIMPSGEGIEVALNVIGAGIKAMFPVLNLIALFQQQIAEESRQQPIDPTSAILNTDAAGNYIFPTGQASNLNNLP